MLGYGIDHHDPVLLERLRDARADRERRAERMGDKLKELGYEIDPSVIEARKEAGKPVGRPHLTQAVIQHPANKERLEREGLNEVSLFLPEYLIPGKPAYMPRTRPTVPEAIRWIHDAGGVAVWAHPFWDVEDPDEVLASIDRFREAGLDGVEVFYATHNAEQTKLLSERCAQLGLLATGSSDFHGPDHKLFSRFLAYEFHGRDPELGPIAEVTGPGAAPGGGGLCLWLTGLSGAGKSTVGHLVASRLREHGHKRRAARRRRRAPQPLRRPRLHARRPRRQHPPHRLRRRPALAQRRDRDRGRDLALPRHPRGGTRADEQPLPRGLGASVRRRVLAPRRQGPVREGPPRRDRALHRRLRPLRGAAQRGAGARHRARRPAAVGREGRRARRGATRRALSRR